MISASFVPSSARITTRQSIPAPMRATSSPSTCVTESVMRSIDERSVRRSCITQDCRTVTLADLTRCTTALIATILRNDRFRRRGSRQVLGLTGISCCCRTQPSVIPNVRCADSKSSCDRESLQGHHMVGSSVVQR